MKLFKIFEALLKLIHINLRFGKYIYLTSTTGSSISDIEVIDVLFFISCLSFEMVCLSVHVYRFHKHLGLQLKLSN